MIFVKRMQYNQQEKVETGSVWTITYIYINKFKNEI